MLGGCLALVAHASVARAADATTTRFGFEYESEPELGCPTAREFQDALVHRLEYDPVAPSGAAAENGVRIRFAKMGTGIEARIDWLDRQGASAGGRQLISESADCAELAQGVVFAVAVQIQLWAETAKAAPPAKEEPPAPAAAVVAPPPQDSRRPRPKSVTAQEFFLGLGASVERGFSPGTAWGANLVAAANRGRGRLELGLRATAPTTRDFPDGTSFDARTFSAWLSPCLRTPPFGWCATGMLGRLYVQGHGVDHALSPASTIAAAGGKVEVFWPALRSFGVLFHAELLGSLTSRSVTLNETKVWSTTPIFVGGGIDLVAIFR